VAAGRFFSWIRLTRVSVVIEGGPSERWPSGEFRVRNLIVERRSRGCEDGIVGGREPVSFETSSF
jgi:hypothetical protein